MPSKKILEAKKAEVAAIKEVFESSLGTVVVDARGLTVEEDTQLRVALRKEGVQYKVRKNTLATKAVEGTAMEGLTVCFKGPTAIATSSESYTAAAKVLAKYAKEFKNLEIKGGYCDGEVLDAAGVERLAKVPDKEALLSMLLSALTGNIRGFAVAVKAVAEQKEQQA
ncbi:MAG: 50S ribosomal protein L10 [Clostridia bacterium]|jgi:large subunit ribosomal protein L10|nr:50S ribosomal protein L10 [Clostridia bacterium]